MRYSIPTNWQDDLIGGLIPGGNCELYGKLSEDIIGGGRASAILPYVSREKARQHIQDAHQKGFCFNYLLNGSCQDNIQYLQSQRKDILEMLDWLIAVEVDSVTISSPYLYHLVRKYAPRLKIYVSVQENINNIFQIKRWDEMGVDKITLSVLDLNRNFSLLRDLRKKIKCDLQLIANLKCLLGCPSYHCHSNLNAHASQSQHRLKGYLIDYYTLRCNYTRLNEPTEFLKSLWIRPEDVHYYEEIGINWLKLVGRQMNSESIHRISKAYNLRRYDGNLLDLLSSSQRHFDFKKMKFIFKYFFRPQHVNILNLLQALNIFKEEGIFIDNRGLDGFLEYFWKEKCNFRCGQQCNYCREVASRVIVIDDKLRQRILKNNRAFRNSLTSGSMFNYF